MYNEQQKIEFIRHYTSSVHMADECKRVFTAIEEDENKWGADFCTMGKDEILPVLERISGIRTRSRHGPLTLLREYARWCSMQGIPGAKLDIRQIVPTGFEKIRSQMIANPAHLESYLNKICEPAEEQTTDNIYRCYYWLAYGGIDEDLVLGVRCSEVDLGNMVVTRNGVDIAPIYREAVPAFKNCIELRQFRYKHPNYVRDIWIDRAPGDTVVRGIRSAPAIKTMRVELSRRSKAEREKGTTDLKLSYYRVWLSGIFYRMYEGECMGIEPDFRKLVDEQTKDKVYSMGKNTQESKRRQLERDYYDDYQRWKIALGL